ncbi:IS66 family transposase [Caloramator quimbayensis]
MTDDSLEIDNNGAERAIKSFVIGKICFYTIRQREQSQVQFSIA